MHIIIFVIFFMFSCSPNISKLVSENKTTDDTHFDYPIPIDPDPDPDPDPQPQPQPEPQYTEKHYVTQTGAGNRNGASLQNAWSLTDFNNTNNWSPNKISDGKIGPGDVIYFSGTIQDRVIVTRGGSAEGSITLDGFEAGNCNPLKEVCSNSAVLEQGMAVGDLVSGPNYLIIQDFRMTRTSSHNSCFTFSGKNSGTDDEKHLENIIVRRNYVYKTKGALFHWRGGRYALIEDNKFVHFGQGFDQTQGINLIELHHSVLRRNEFGHDEIAYPSLCKSAEMIELHGCQNILMEYNNIYGAPNQAGIRPKEHSPLDNRNQIFRFNKIHSNLGLGPGETNGAGIHMNTRETEHIQNFYIYGNYIFNNMVGVKVGRNVSNIHVWSNIISSNTRSAIASWHTSDNFNIYNNTIAYNNTSNDDVLSRGGASLSYTTNVHIKNNILWNNRPAGERSRMAIYSGITLSSLEHNLYFHPMGDPTIYYNGGYQTIATMKSTYNFEKVLPAGEIIDPLFTNPRGTDNAYGTFDDNYTLKENSPAIDSGANISNCYEINIGNNNNLFIERTGYNMVKVCLEDALCPIQTDWKANPPTVITKKQQAIGNGWEKGAYVYIEK